MGTYERKAFRPVWGLLAVVVALNAFFFHQLVLGRAWIAAFMLLELWGAYRRSKDDTLSEFSGWLSTIARGGTKFHRTLAGALAVLFCWQAGFVLSFGPEGQSAAEYYRIGGHVVFVYGPNLLAGLVVTLAGYGWLSSHFVRMQDAPESPA